VRYSNERNIRAVLLRLLSIPFLGLAMIAQAFSQEACRLDALDFPNDSFFDALDAVSSSAITRPDVPLLSAQLAFVGPKPDPNHEFEHPAYDVILQLRFDGMKVRSTWENEARNRLTDVGCSSQTLHSFSASTADGAMHGYFHVKYVKRSCGSWPWGGGWATDVATIETDVWQDFTLAVANDHVTTGMTGRASDNVSQLARDLGKVLGNLFAIYPLTGGLVLGLDKQVFEALKAERDALEEAGTFRIVDDQSISEDDPNQKFTLSKAWFDGPPTGIVINVSAVRGNLDKTQSCKLREKLNGQERQGTALKSAVDYIVKPGDSAWRIAQTMYGSGQYFWLIAGINNLNGEQINNLQAGQHLHLESLGSVLRDGNQVPVKNKDSLWRISRSQGSGKSLNFSDILNANSHRFDDPDFIYPLQLVSLIKKDNQPKGNTGGK
jgi:LysM repeat protein